MRNLYNLFVFLLVISVTGFAPHASAGAFKRFCHAAVGRLPNLNQTSPTPKPKQVDDLRSLIQSLQPKSTEVPNIVKAFWNESADWIKVLRDSDHAEIETLIYRSLMEIPPNANRDLRLVFYTLLMFINNDDANIKGLLGIHQFLTTISFAKYQSVHDLPFYSRVLKSIQIASIHDLEFDVQRFAIFYRLHLRHLDPTQLIEEAILRTQKSLQEHSSQQ